MLSRKVYVSQFGMNMKLMSLRLVLIALVLQLLTLELMLLWDGVIQCGQLLVLQSGQSWNVTGCTLRHQLH